MTSEFDKMSKEKKIQWLERTIEKKEMAVKKLISKKYSEVAYEINELQTQIIELNVCKEELDSGAKWQNNKWAVKAVEYVTKIANAQTGMTKVLWDGEEITLYLDEIEDNDTLGMYFAIGGCCVPEFDVELADLTEEDYNRLIRNLHLFELKQII